MAYHDETMGLSPEQQKIFNEEQKHLSDTFQILEDMKEELESKIEDLKAKASDEKNDIRDNVTLDYADDEAKAEAYSEIETWNRYIDTYNVTSALLNSNLKKVKRLMDAPYFARVTLQFSPDEEPEDYYIGNEQLSKKGDYFPLVIDWRAPIAETYYNQENGRTSYEVDGRRIPVDLLLRRQFDLSKDQLKAYFDTQVAIEDSLLLKSLSRQHNDKMRDITATIQKEQNAVIRHKDVPVFLVHGIAGSGKTSVLLQRIAFLFYRKRETLRPDQVYLLTLNPVFRQYIANVLPDMGERNPNTYTWQEFLNSVGVPFRDKEHDRTKIEDLILLKEKLKELPLKMEYFQPIYQKDRRIFSSNAVKQILEEFHIPLSVHLIKVAEDELEERARIIMRKKKKQINERSSERERQDAEKEMSQSEENSLNNNLGGAIRYIHKYGWINVSAIGGDLLGRDYLSASEWFYLKMLLTGECDSNAKYVMVDEVQDYTEAQLMVLRRYFPNAKFMLLGDEFQAIRKGTATFAKIKELFGKDGREVVDMPLMTSYRSSPEITEVFTSLLPEEEQVRTSSVQRAGQKPVIHQFHSTAEFAEKLEEDVKTARDKDETTAIIAMNRKSINRVIGALEERGFIEEDIPRVIRANQALPKKGIFIIELEHAKGLEFDHVIIPDADADHYASDLLSRHRLYTAVSRATQYLTIYADGKVSPLLESFKEE